MNLITATILIFISTLSLVTISTNASASDEYISLKGGIFLPNGDGQTNGTLKDYDTGYNFEIAAGFNPESYASIEIGTGFYRAQRSYNYNFDSTKPTKDVISGIPLLLTIKGILPLEKVDFFAGAGAGYYFSVLEQNTPTLSLSQHAGKLGYHAVGGVDFKMSEHFSLGAEAKWFRVKPSFENINAIGQQTYWELGGTTMNLALKYRFH